MRRWRPAYVALGSNLADPAAQLRSAFARLAALPQSLLVARSGLWSSRPLGPREQPDYVNAAAGLLTRLSPRELLAELKVIEASMGRAQPAPRWGPRIIDLDLVAFGCERIDEPGLRVPHPGVHQRDFVLYPLAEFAATLWIPGQGRVATLARQVENRGLVALGAVSEA
jgi:2-amino-4-hydroxy-6-hydroxymethyldihydropteridine diphosphokinase